MSNRSNQRRALLICAWAAWRRDYHKYAHANVSAASPLLNCHIDAHHPQQWATLKARTHRPTVSKSYKAKLPLSSPQDVRRTPAIGLALPAHQERPRKGLGRTTKRIQPLSAPATTRVRHGPRQRRPLRKNIATHRRRSPKPYAAIMPFMGALTDSRYLCLSPLSS